MKSTSSCLLCKSHDFLPVKRLTNTRIIETCMHCGFAQVNPRMTPAACARLYKDDWDHFGPYISQIPAHRIYFTNLLRVIGTYVPLEHARLLDIGCALGILLDVAKSCGVQAEGIDISTGAVTYAKKQHLSVSHDTCASWYKKKKNKSRYSVITALEVIEHEADPLGMMKTVHTMLRPGGIVVITTPDFNTIFRKLMGDAWVGYQHREHLWFFTPKHMTRLLEQAGFSDIRVQNDINRPYSISYMFRRLGDYILSIRPVTSLFERITKRIHVALPVNPWGDMLVIAIKP